MNVILCASLVGCVNIPTVKDIPQKNIYLVNDEIVIEKAMFDKIWAEAQKVAGVGTAYQPEIKMGGYSPSADVWKDIYGTYFSGDRHITIWLAEIVGKHEEKNILVIVCYVVAHEYLHHLYDYKYPVARGEKFDNGKIRDDHCLMIETGDIDKLNKFVSKVTQVKDYWYFENFMLDAAEYGCRAGL